MKTKYELVKRNTVSSNTAEHGFGDYSTTTWERLATVEASNVRQAQNAFKKMMPNLGISFSGQFARYQAWEVAA